MQPQSIAHASTGRLMRKRRTFRSGAFAIAMGLVPIGSVTLQPSLVAQASRDSRDSRDSRESHEPRGCSVATLKGRYLFGGTGTLLPPAFGVTMPALASTAGAHIFNGDGTGTDIVTFRVNGVTVLENTVVSFTYTVDEDCTGAYAVPNGPSFGMFIAPTGDELVVIATDPGDIVVFGPSTRVSRN